MDRKKTILLFMGMWTAAAHAQSPVQDSIAAARNKSSQTHLYILGAWAGANIIQGTISASNTSGPDHYFHQMNVYWNTVNLAVTGAGLLVVKKQLTRHFTFADNLRQQQKTERILLVNTGLDVAYITTGLFLKERGDHLAKQQLQGYGSSLVLQGGFLLVLDVIQYFSQRKNGKWLENQLGTWQVGTTANGMGLTYTFRR